MYMALKRKQIYLDPASDKTLKQLAQETGLSEAEHIRRAVAAYMSQQTPEAADRSADPLLQLIGMCRSPKGPRDAALHHDRYLYGRRP